MDLRESWHPKLRRLFECSRRWPSSRLLFSGGDRFATERKRESIYLHKLPASSLSVGTCPGLLTELPEAAPLADWELGTFEPKPRINAHLESERALCPLIWVATSQPASWVSLSWQMAAKQAFPEAWRLKTRRFHAGNFRGSSAIQTLKGKWCTHFHPHEIRQGQPFLTARRACTAPTGTPRTWAVLRQRVSERCESA